MHPSRAAPIVNTAILGAIVKASGICSLENILKAIKNSAPVKKEENANAAAQAFEATQEA